MASQSYTAPSGSARSFQQNLARTRSAYSFQQNSARTGSVHSFQQNPASSTPPPAPSLRTSSAGSQAGTAVGGDEIRSYYEVDFLKEAVGQPLVSALADLCLHRPTDPIEYLAHWLVHWKFNQELKKQDVKTALELVQQREWQKYKNVLGFTSEGFTPQHPFGQIGYGGPVFGGDGEAEAVAISEHSLQGGDGADVEQLYRNEHAQELEMPGEYGDRYPSYAHLGQDEESEYEDSERPISYYSDLATTATEQQHSSAQVDIVESKAS